MDNRDARTAMRDLASEWEGSRGWTDGPAAGMADRMAAGIRTFDGMPSGYWVISAQVLTHNGEWHGSRQVPTFYLHERVQMFTDAAGAELAAKSVINPLGTIADDDIRVTAVRA